MKKNVVAVLIAFFSISTKAMTLDCYAMDLATADIFGNIHIENFSPMDFNEEKNFEIESPYIYSSFRFLYHPEISTIDLIIDSQSDIERSVKSFSTKLKFERPKLKLGSTAIMSQSLNLDTLYSFCEITL